MVADTMIDNIRFSSSSLPSLVSCCKKFMILCDLFNITLNEREKYDDQFLFTHATAEHTLLGELYKGTKIFNSEKNLAKLDMAMRNLDSKDLTYRNLISIISLILFLVHTLMSPTGPFFSFASFFSLIRFYSSLSSIANREGYDKKVEFIQDKRKEELIKISNFLLSNPFSHLSPLPGISTEHKDYFALIICDACAIGWAAYISFPACSKTFLLQQRFNDKMKTKLRYSKNFSAHTEPLGATRAISFVKRYKEQFDRENTNKRIALVTDHAPIVFGQRKNNSFYSGFSSSFLLNNMFLNFYEDGWDTQAWYVAGPMNPADGPSRDIPPSSSILTNPSSFCFPHLSNFFHPHLANNPSFPSQTQPTINNA